MQFKFLDHKSIAPSSGVVLDPILFRKTLYWSQKKTEIEIHLQFLREDDVRCVARGELFLATVAKPIRFASRQPKPLLYKTHDGTGALENVTLVHDRFPEAWVTPDRTSGKIKFVNSPYSIKRVGLCLKSDISVKEYGPLLHGCRLLNRDANDFLYVVYDATQKEFSLDTEPPRVVESLRAMCLQAATIATLYSTTGGENKYPDYSRLPLELREFLQRLLSPIRQMSSPKSFKTVKIWHVNQKLYQEIEYDAKTKKYHGKARMWDFSGRLILVLYFNQGLMHGDCITTDPRRGNLITSHTIFKMNKPIGQLTLSNKRKVMTVTLKTSLVKNASSAVPNTHIKKKQKK